MFIKYPKTARIRISQIDVAGKFFLSDAETKQLLAGQVVITEKLDGANCAIIRNKNDFRLQKRSGLVGESEHQQFNYFKAWSQINCEKLMQIPKHHILYGELMFAKHTIHYDLLPDFFLAFALYDVQADKFKPWYDLEELCVKIGLHTAPFILQGYVSKNELFDYIPNPSAYGHEPAEGIVVSNKHGMRGKIVRPEFMKMMEQNDHWIHQQVVRNKLAK